MSAFCLKKLENFRRTSSSWNLILSSRKLHDASSTAPPVEKKLKLLEDTQQLCESESDHKALDITWLKNIDIRWYVANFKVEHIIKKIENLHVLQSILETCLETNQHFLVFKIYSIIRSHPHCFELNGKICRLLVHSCVVMKDFEGAYKMVNELQKKYFKYRTTMYNAIMAGYFFEKNISGGLRVLKEMRDANVKLDSYTFSYLIGNCETKEEIKKYYEEMEQFGIHLTKEVFVSLIHAYAACSEFDAEKQDVLFNLHGELERVLLLLKELSGQDWVDGCRWAILYSVQNKNLSSTIELFKQLKDYYNNDAFKRGDPFYLKRKGHDLFDEAYYLILKYGSTYLQFGLDLLDLIRKELGLVPSKLCLDGLLTLCAISRDLNNAHLVWREYVFARHPYSGLSYLSVLTRVTDEDMLMFFKLHDASSTAPPLLDYASTRQEEKKQLWISRKDTQQLCESESDQISVVLKNIDIVWFIDNFKVEHIVKKIENLHGVLPASSMYEKLILYCCSKDKVDVAIHVVDKMCEAAGFTLSSHVMQSVLETCSETNQHFRVFEIYSIISRHPHHFELNGEICRLLVHCCVVMKDFERAFKMVNELQKKYFKYKTTMYNAIMAGYFSEKNIIGGLRVLKQMRLANLKLDSYTFSYLIGNCETKEEIKKYYEEMEQSGIHLTKEVFVALIHAYAACSEDSEDSEDEDSEDYEEQDVLFNLHGELERVLLLLKELSGQDWVDGCRWAILYSVQNKNLSSTIELFKQLKDYYNNDASERRSKGNDIFYFRRMSGDVFNEAYFRILKNGTTYLQFGLDLLDLIKKELGCVPPKRCLDILLTLCGEEGDLNNANLVWREFVSAKYPYGSLSYLSMYHVLLASGDHKSAEIILNKVPSFLSGIASDLKKHYYPKMDDVLVSDT